MNWAEKFKQLEPKRKITLVVTSILFLVFLYLAYDTIFSKEEYLPPSKTTQKIQQLPKPNSVTKPNIAANPTLRNLMPKKPNIEKVPEDKPTVEQLAILKDSENLQREYLKLLNEYQLAELQQKLEAANSAIAATKLKILTTQSQTKQIEDKLRETGTLLANGKNPNQEEYNVQVAYVGQKRGEWVAMLKINNNYFEVKVGTELSDGSIVEEINENGVVLDKNGNKNYLRVPKSLD